MLTSLRLENFKSWKRIEKMRFAPITGLFGPNSSGKTSILQLLLLLKQTIQSSDQMQVLDLGDENSYAEMGTFTDIVYGHKQSGSLSWSLSFKLPGPLTVVDPEAENTPLFRDDNLTFSARVEESNRGRLTVRRMGYLFAQHDFSCEPTSKHGRYRLAVSGPSEFQFKRKVGRPWDLGAPVNFFGFPKRVYSHFQNADFVGDLQWEFEKQFYRMFYLGPVREYPRPEYAWGGAEPADMGRRGEKVVSAILSSREQGVKISRGKGLPKLTLEEYVARWLKGLGLIDSFAVEPVSKGSNLFQVNVRKTPMSTPVKITEVGFGVSQILPVIALCYYVPEGSTVILEQPEIHLHPSVQAGLADVFIDAIRVRKIQIIIESHSEHLLRRIQRRIAEGARLTSEDVALYFCRFDGVQSKLDPLDVDAYGNIKNWPKDFFGDEMGEMAAMVEAAIRRRSKLGS